MKILCMFRRVAVRVLGALVLLFLLSCKGSGNGNGGYGAFIYAELTSVAGSNFSAAFVYVVDDATGEPLKASVDINGVALKYNAQTQEYEGELSVAPGDGVSLNVSANGNSYSAAGIQFSAYPVISSPTPSTLWPIRCANTLAWSFQNPTSETFYGIGVQDAATGQLIWPSSGYLQTLSNDSLSYDIPGAGLAAGDAYALVAVARPLAIANASEGSEFIIGGLSYVPITIADVSPTITSIVLKPLNPLDLYYSTLPKNVFKQFAATGKYCDGTITDVTGSVNWNSSDTGVAVISNEAGSKGMVNTITSGTTTISATAGTINDSMSLAVSRWTQQASGTSASLYGIAWSGSTYVAVGTGVILTSSDLVTWTTHSTDYGLWGRVRWLGGQFIALAYNIILTSPDGITWTPQASEGGAWLYDVAWSGTKYVVVGESGVIHTSPNGVTWTKQASASESLSGVAWDGHQFVAVGGALILTSPDGVMWTEQSSGPNAGSGMTSIVWTGSRFVAAGGYILNAYFCNFLTSTDGKSWDSTIAYTGQNIVDLAWSGTSLIGVGYAGAIVTSPDGNVMTSEVSGIYNNSLLSVLAADNKFVIVGSNGIVLTYP